MSPPELTPCVITSSRADYGLLKPLLKKLQQDNYFNLQLLVTGSHLSASHGKTVSDIRDDEFTIDAEVPVSMDNGTPIRTAKAMAETISGVATSLNELEPDLVIVLGDRFEIFASAQAACVLSKPIAHLHGGELSEGTMDESFRHAITKLAQCHLVATEPYRKRVIQLGEDPEYVHNVGALALDAIKNETLLSKLDLEDELNLSLKAPILLMTYHPPTHEEIPPAKQIHRIVESLDKFDGTQIFTGTNPDPGYEPIRKAIQNYCEGDSNDRIYVPHLGHQKYVSLVKEADAVVGNSSSGLYEAPFLGTPTVNIGSRQEGRIKPNSVLDVSLDTEAISKALSKALSDDFRSSWTPKKTPYGEGRAAETIIQILKDQKDWSVKKQFHDIPFEL